MRREYLLTQVNESLRVTLEAVEFVEAAEGRSARWRQLLLWAEQLAREVERLLLA